MTKSIKITSAGLFRTEGLYTLDQFGHSPTKIQHCLLESDRQYVDVIRSGKNAKDCASIYKGKKRRRVNSLRNC